MKSMPGCHDSFSLVVHDLKAAAALGAGFAAINVVRRFLLQAILAVLVATVQAAISAFLFHELRFQNILMDVDSLLLQGDHGLFAVNYGVAQLAVMILIA
jgi:hypothetical protein